MFDEQFKSVVREAVKEALVDIGQGNRKQRRLLNLDEAGEYLGRSPEAVRHLYRKGVIPGTLIDGRLQFDVKELDKLIEASTRWAA